MGLKSGADDGGNTAMLILVHRWGTLSDRFDREEAQKS